MEELKSQLQQTITAKAWEKISISSHHGINLPLSALHSGNSCGIGEFFDLIPLIDWCEKLKLDVIQLLPLNNSERDPSPYNAISSCAINFIYLSLDALPYLEKMPQLKLKFKELRKLSTTDQISFTDVYTHKLSWLHEYFDTVGEKFLKSKQLKQFVEENTWVQHYALFKTLKERLGHTSWTSWPQELQMPSPDKIRELSDLYKNDIDFYVTLQYLCYSQLKKIKAYANQKGILLMGDIPILVSKESVDVWQYPQYFDMTLSAGAPPDYYNQEGQDWGFPLFQWDALRKNDFDWWKQRLKYADHFFDIFRIDHVIGFFRIWGIPLHHLAKEGHFIPEKEEEWEPHGREILSMIARSTSMLPIAEDLGVVPPIVRPILKEMGICSTKVMRWERMWEEDKRYIPIQYYPPISLTCISTHDSETLTQWWSKFPDEAQVFATFKHWEYVPDLTLEQRQEILWDSHHTSSLFHINLLQEYLALYPELIRPTPEEERINIPGTILPSNWTYRFKPSVEEFTTHEGLFSKMEKILHSPSPT